MRGHVRSVIQKEHRSAEFSSDRVYRYVLRIRWDADLNKPNVLFIGLNPSTADEKVDDPTLRRCKGFAKQWGFGGLIMTNLFAFRSTDPRALLGNSIATGESGCFLTAGGTQFDNRNDYWLYAMALVTTCRIACWGAHKSAHQRSLNVRCFLPVLKCIRFTSKGHPQHPLYLPYDQRPFDELITLLPLGVST